MRIYTQRMKKIIQYKDITDGLQDVDRKGRTLKIAIASFGDRNLDRDGDVILHSAVTKTIKERGPKGSNEIWHLTDHWYAMDHALGKFKELYVERDYLIGISSPSRTKLGNDVMELYADGHINQHSIGFTPLAEESSKGGYNVIKELALWEGSSVLWGANPNTPTLDVVKSLTKEKAASMLERTIKSLRNGSYSDETFSLLELQLKQIQQYILDMEEKATAPALTTQPAGDQVDYVKVAAELSSITNLFKK